jgi:hypothetical protein
MNREYCKVNPRVEPNPCTIGDVLLVSLSCGGIEHFKKLLLISFLEVRNNFLCRGEMFADWFELC